MRRWQVEEARQRVQLEEMLWSKVTESANLGQDIDGKPRPFTPSRAQNLLRAAEAMEPLPRSGRTGHKQYRLHYQKRFSKENKGGGWFSCGGR